jgi:hypothetical protein
MEELLNFLKKIPSIKQPISSEIPENGLWWVKFSIELGNSLAWNVIQELGHVINYISVDDKLPCIFYPVSPPPYLNGGPEVFLSWIIETKDKEFTPEVLKEWLEGRLPNPVEETDEWKLE